MAVVALWCASLIGPAATAADDMRMLGAFQTDEALQVNLLIDALDSGRFAFNYGTYPHLYFNVALMPLTLLSLLRAPTEHDIAMVLRGVCLFSATATLLLVWVWAGRIYGSAVAWLAMTVLMTNPMFYEWAVYAHPDVVQVFLLMLALFLLAQFIDCPSTGRLLVTAVAAGMAFATKYGGLPLLLLIWVAVIFNVIRNRRPQPAIGAPSIRIVVAMLAVAMMVGATWLDATWIAAHFTEDGTLDLPAPERTLGLLRHAVQGAAAAVVALALWPRPWAALARGDRVRRVIQDIASSVIVFVAVFAIVSPYSWRRLAFVKGLAYHTVHGGLVEPVTTFNWTGMLSVEAGAWVVVAAALTAVWVILGRGRSGIAVASDVVLVTWNVMFCAVLFLPVHGIAVHYMLPLIPPMILLACRGLVVAAVTAGRALPAMAVRRTAAACAVAVLIVLQAPLVVRLAAERRSTLARVEQSDAVWVGRWLQCHAPRSTRVAYDYLSFVPASFQNVKSTWGGTLPWLHDADPDAVIVNGFVSGHYARDDPERAAYYAALANGRAGFDRVLTRGTFTVYARADRLPDLARAAAAVVGCLPEAAAR